MPLCTLRLNANYAPYQDGNVPRQGLYNSYRRVCDEYRIPHVNTATLGKAIRLCFPAIKTRRLGVRGNSKYHCAYNFFCWFNFFFLLGQCNSMQFVYPWLCLRVPRTFLYPIPLVHGFSTWGSSVAHDLYNANRVQPNWERHILRSVSYHHVASLVHSTLITSHSLLFYIGWLLLFGSQYSCRY